MTLPGWVTLVRADNAGPFTLEGTNTWVLADGTVIDPGPDDEAHLKAVAGVCRIERILVTHHHFDHTDGIARLVEMTGARVGELPPGLRALKAPGHTADSVCFIHDEAVFTGDTILGRGSSVVAWPDGNVGDYLSSLRLLSEFSGIPALPGHGPALPDCAEAAKWLLAHRLERLDQVREAMRQGATTPEEVVAIVYASVEPGLQAAALWTVRAQLHYLQSLDPTP